MSPLLDAIGNTPLVRLHNLVDGAHFSLCAKLEGLNPGGSVKDRAARQILLRSLEAKIIDRNSVIVESSSGNMAVGFAQAANVLGMRFIAVVDPNASRTNLAIARALGAEVDLVKSPDPETGDFLTARVNRVQEHLARIPNAFWPNQYSNQFNSQAHWKTMAEICEQLGKAPDYLICATSSCGTLRGCWEYARREELDTCFIGVDAVGSMISGFERGARLIPGHGAGIRPALFRPEFVERFVRVTDLECVMGCRRVAATEGLLVGGSSGGVAAAVARLCFDIPVGADCVLIFADRGERYLDTVYDDEWVRQSFGTSQFQVLQEAQRTWSWAS